MISCETHPFEGNWPQGTRLPIVTSFQEVGKRCQLVGLGICTLVYHLKLMSRSGSGCRTDFTNRHWHGGLGPNHVETKSFPPSSKHMGHYLCIGVQETIWSSQFRPSLLWSNGRDNLKNQGSFPGTDTQELGFFPWHRYTRAQELGLSPQHKQDATCLEWMTNRES